ncbi:MAG: hypothetical protein OCC45_06610 [Desulfotalea sp.]
MEVLKEELAKLTHISEFDLSGAKHVFDMNRTDNICPACNYTFTDSIALCPDCGLAVGATQ